MPELNLVMEKDGVIIGQVAFARARITCDDGRVLPCLALGPVCIASEYKRRGYGRALPEHAFDRAAALGFGAVCFEGNIAFYGTCGCVETSHFGIRYHGWHEGEVEAFDAEFPPKEKLRLPGQLF